MTPDREAALRSGARIARAGDWLSAEVGDEMVMMSAASGLYIGLSDTGRRIWEILETPQTLAELCAILAAEYDAPQEEVTADVVPFLAILLERSAVTLTPA